MARKKRDQFEAVIEYFETTDIVKAQMALTTVQYLLKARIGPTPAFAPQRKPKAATFASTPVQIEPVRSSGSTLG